MLLRKISVKTVFGDKGTILETVMNPDNKGKIVPLMRVVGVAKRLQTGKSKFDDRESDEQQEWIKFIGEFEAISARDGTVFESPNCFLPAFAAEIIAGRFDATRDVQDVPVGFDIGAHYSPDAITSYEFDIVEHEKIASPTTEKMLLAANKNVGEFGKNPLGDAPAIEDKSETTKE